MFRRYVVLILWCTIFLLQGKIIQCRENDKEEKYSSAEIDAFHIVGFLSVVFTLFTLITYLSVPKNLHVLLIIALTSCLLLFYFSEMVASFSGFVNISKMCHILSFSSFYFGIGSYFWMQAIAFNNWRSIKRLAESSSNVVNKKLFIPYICYVCGMSAAFLTRAIYLETISKNDTYMSTVFCFYHYATEATFGIAWASMLITNIFFFISSSIRIKYNKYIIMESRIESSVMNTKIVTETETERYWTCLKIFIVMTIPLIMLQIIRDVAYFHNEDYITFTAELIVDFQGFFIFIVCVWTTEYRDVFLRCVLPAKCAPSPAATNATINELQWTPAEYKTVGNGIKK